ncbi:hypothetical protein QJS04_geneDACA021794 [Acorus gramineus]|uniref:Uncharacterized protein n=1 Tax=Acorus gramineus TaxID=55184 RepID=A0AAV9A4Y6_ACOGR|nr:hypothetical protein QJS04_geneDACA021794 [Acorus gramineus]
MASFHIAAVAPPSPSAVSTPDQPVPPIRPSEAPVSSYYSMCSTSLVSEHPSESSNVIDSRGPDAKKGLCDQDSGSSLRCQPNGRGGMSRLLKSDQFRSPQFNRKTSGSVSSPHSESGHSVMAPESPFGSSNQSAGRRNQAVNDLYTMYIDYVKQYHVGDHPEFTLLTRSKDSSVPILKRQQKVALPSSTEDFCGSFAKFTLTSDVEMSVREAKRDLNDWLAKADSGLVDDLEKLPYVCAALEQLDLRMKRWQDHEVMTGSPPVINRASLSSKPRVLKNSSPKTQDHALSSIGVAFEAGSEEHQLPFGTHHVVQRNDSENSGWLSPEKLETDSLGLSDDVRQLFENPKKTTFNEGKGPGKPLHGSKDIQERDSYTFYQAIDGQHLILHPLNMKCLLHYYGSYDSLPPRVGGKILQLETVTQSGSMRKRYRFLSHFSLTTTFQLCEIDLSEILPPDALSPFIEEIRRRENQRKQVAEKELEEKAKADAAAMQETLTQLDFRHSLNNDAAFSIEDFEALGSGTAPSTSPPVVGERKLFSDVTRLGFASAHDSPALKVETSAGSPSKVEERGETSVITGHRNMPTLSFANIVSTATKASDDPEVPRVEGFRKKGKKSSRILLSTTGGRRY